MKYLNKVLGTFMAAIVAIMVLVCCWQVVTRFILNSPSKYTEEMLRYALIWLTMLGAPYAYGQNRHLSINFVTAKFQPSNLLLTKILVEIVVLVLSISVFIVGGMMVTMNAAGQISAAMQMPMQLYYICIPLSGILMTCYCLERIVKFFKEWKENR